MKKSFNAMDGFSVPTPYKGGPPKVAQIQVLVQLTKTEEGKSPVMEIIADRFAGRKMVKCKHCGSMTPEDAGAFEVCC